MAAAEDRNSNCFDGGVMFLTSRDDFDFKPLVKSRVMMQGALGYQDSVCGKILVPDEFICDLASYGRISRAIFDKIGQSMRPAVLHDYLYKHRPGDISRGCADRVYREALVLEGASLASAYTQWLGVRAGGWIAWNNHRKVSLAEKGGDPDLRTGQR